MNSRRALTLTTLIVASACCLSAQQPGSCSAKQLAANTSTGAPRVSELEARSRYRLSLKSAGGTTDRVYVSATDERITVQAGGGGFGEGDRAVTGHRSRSDE